jgi:hypothetical protein
MLNLRSGERDANVNKAVIDKWTGGKIVSRKLKIMISNLSKGPKFIGAQFCLVGMFRVFTLPVWTGLSHKGAGASKCNRRYVWFVFDNEKVFRFDIDVIQSRSVAGTVL